MSAYDYDKITKYAVTAVCDGPLHIGSAEGDGTYVLIHPVDGRPFIQASSLAGVMRAWYSRTDIDKCEELFGRSRFMENENASEFQSRVRFTDAAFADLLRIERRPHVRIDDSTGTVKSANGSGQRFDMEYVGAGAEFSFDVYLYESSDGENLTAEFEKILSAMKSGELQFGGKKSSGGGRVHLKTVVKDKYDLKDAVGRQNWIHDENSESDHCADYLAKLPEYIPSDIAYRVFLKGKTSGPIQVRGLAVAKFGEKAPDSENIRNAKGEYIVPGTSLKGVMRSRMQMIADYKGQPALIGQCFGTENDTDGGGAPGNLIFSDAVIGTIEKNDRAVTRNRIHIDKFTGGAMNQGLFSEKNAYGDIAFTIEVKKRNDPDAALGLLLYALRDLAAGLVNIGNGYSTGKGFVDVDEIKVTRVADGKSAVITRKKDKSGVSIPEYNTVDSDGIIPSALQSAERRTA